MKINEPRHQQFLRELKLFRNLGDEELKLVKKCLTIIEVPKEGIVFERYSKEQVLYIIRYGKLKLESIGNETRLFEMGDFFGEIGLMNTN
jgi:signal-transduction protein with cAMP-binding, CBS, and nucleotidyltransferase domain